MSSRSSLGTLSNAEWWNFRKSISAGNGGESGVSLLLIFGVKTLLGFPFDATIPESSAEFVGSVCSIKDGVLTVVCFIKDFDTVGVIVTVGADPFLDSFFLLGDAETGDDPADEDEAAEAEGVVSSFLVFLNRCLNPFIIVCDRKRGACPAVRMWSTKIAGCKNRIEMWYTNVMISSAIASSFTAALRGVALRYSALVSFGELVSAPICEWAVADM